MMLMTCLMVAKMEMCKFTLFSICFGKRGPWVKLQKHWILHFP